MSRGRKAEVGTYEARKYVLYGCLDRLFSDEKDLSNEACARIIKAVKFGLGIKEEKINKVVSKVVQEETSVAPIKEKEVLRKASSSIEVGDEYFKPEDCKEVGY